MALVSALFSVTASETTAYTLHNAYSTDLYTVLDAHYMENHATEYSSQYQLSECLSQYDPDWAAGNPTFSYSSLNTSVARVSSGGLVTFLQSGSCVILVTAAEDGYNDKIFAVYLTGATWGGA